jgi:two-component system sensor histidine kinase/response regulator
MQVAEHLTVAITQAQHHQQLQQQKQTLEQQVAEYTQELQEVLMATQVANRAKNEFLATMSHELRTPLACVIGMSSTLLHWSFGSLNQRQRDYLQTIHDSGEHLLEIINDILQVSELEAGKTTLNLSQFPLSRLAYNCERMFREKARMGNLELKVEVYLQPNQDLFRGDARRIQQIIMNLLSNGIKFTPPQGKVTLRLWREGKVAVWQVEDTGIGIAPEQHGLLFQKFQQLDTSIRREYSGTGLGLALTKQFVDLHQGQIELESEVGQGAKFTVRLPCQVLPIVKPMVNNSGIEHFPAQGQIILLEDDEETATLICELLTAVGYQVVWLVDASTAIDQIEFLKPVAIVVDLNLSGMGNHDIITRFRQLVDMDHLKIVALGLETTITQVKRHSPPFQADLYLCKPLEPNQLITSITSLTAPEWDGAS